MRQYPIWNKVQAPDYKDDKSWGAKKGTLIEVQVGSSSSNSYDHARILTHKVLEDGEVHFVTLVNGVEVCRSVFKACRRNSGKAREFMYKTTIEVESYRYRIPTDEVAA